jgi:hypothetical protein
MRCLPTPDCADGAAAINLSGSVTGVYAVGGGLTAAIALAFAFSPVAHGDRYLEGAAGRRPGPRALDIRLGPGPPSARAPGMPGFPGAGPAGGSADAGRSADGSKEVR